MTDKPEWWPQNPYFESAMGTIKDDEDYIKAVPDEHLRTCVSWYLGNRFWTVASDMIWEAVQNHMGDICRQFFDEAINQEQCTCERFIKNPKSKWGGLPGPHHDKDCPFFGEW